MTEDGERADYAQAHADLNRYYKDCQTEVVELIKAYERLKEELVRRCTQKISSIEAERQAFLAEEEEKKTAYLEQTDRITKSIGQIRQGMLKGSTTAGPDLEVKLAGKRAELAAVNSLPVYSKAMSNIEERRAELDEKSEATKQAMEDFKEMKDLILKGMDGSSEVGTTTGRTRDVTKTRMRTAYGTGNGTATYGTRDGTATYGTRDGTATYGTRDRTNTYGTRDRTNTNGTGPGTRTRTEGDTRTGSRTTTRADTRTGTKTGTGTGNDTTKTRKTKTKTKTKSSKSKSKSYRSESESEDEEEEDVEDEDLFSDRESGSESARSSDASDSD